MTVDNISDTLKGKSCEDEKTECSTPFCSPERESAAGNTKQLDLRRDEQTHQDETQPKSSKSAATETLTSSDVINSDEDVSKEDYKNWPMVEIKEPSSNDVLYGRGGG